jgi:hypothetical protein
VLDVDATNGSVGGVELLGSVTGRDFGAVDATIGTTNA